MVFDRDFDFMLKAKGIASYSNCDRRKIGVYIPIQTESASISGAYGYNKVPKTTHCCGREFDQCPAMHAEVVAILNADKFAKTIKQLYIWAECPCHQCLTFIKENSTITTIYCLTPESYLNEYPRIATRLMHIKRRLKYAKDLGIDVIQMDREEILEYELSIYTQSNI